MSSPTSFNKFRRGPRKAVRVSTEELVNHRPLLEDGLPLLFEPAGDHINLGSWVEGNRQLIDSKLVEHGALLFRGFGLDGADDFYAAAETLSPDLLDYTERAAPRHQVGSQKVFTSTEFPADQVIPLHHEMSYSHNWPTRLFFFCAQPPAARGCTPLADDRKVVKLLDAEIKAEFLDKGVMYVRNYGEGVDMSWREVFQTEDRAEVEAYCRASHMEWEWRDGDRLRTRARRQVTATHPVTGETLWFNHAHMFHQSNLEPEVREALLSEFAPDELPRNAFFGDGSPIPAEHLEHVRGVYNDVAVTFPWQKGDLLVVDNFLASHGRESFEGPRKILVVMAELYTGADARASRS